LVADLYQAANSLLRGGVLVLQSDELDDPDAIGNFGNWEVNIEHECDFVRLVKEVV
jgi:hypothetical protein